MRKETNIPSRHKARRYKERGSPKFPSLCKIFIPSSKLLRARKWRIASPTTQYLVKHSTSNLNKNLQCHFYYKILMKPYGDKWNEYLRMCVSAYLCKCTVTKSKSIVIWYKMCHISFKAMCNLTNSLLWQYTANENCNINN